MIRTLYTYFGFFGMLILLWSSAFAQSNAWNQVEEGLFVGEFGASMQSAVGDSKVTVVRINPRLFSLKLVCASEHGNTRRTAKQWCNSQRLVAAINAGMFLTDGLTNTGFMKNYAHINNKKLNSYKSVLAFNPTIEGIPEVQLLDRQCDSFDSLTSRYNTLIQDIRMISCHHENAWQEQNRRWSMVAMGMDTTGQVLFFYTRSPYSVHEFIDILLALPLSVARAMYLEGGPEASLYLSASGTEIDKLGSFETGFNENDDNDHAWPIPNVIGIVRKVKN